MLLAHGDLRVSHVTTHVALEDVPKRLTPERLRRVLDLTLEALRGLGIARAAHRRRRAQPACRRGRPLRPRRTSTSPRPSSPQAVARRHATSSGPVPGDTVFVKLRAGQYDAVVAMYHDQGHIPVKLLGFQVDPATGRGRRCRGVNITLGLPIIRTSVDHGTAFDIAGKGIANERSLIEAIEYAEQLAASGIAASKVAA